MTIYQLKGQFQKIAIKFAHSGLTPNMAIVFGCFFALTTAMSFYVGTLAILSDSRYKFFLLLAPLSIFFRMIFNALDGLIARKNNQATAMGELLNELGDVWGDTLSYGVFFFIPGISSAHVFIYIVLIWFAELTALLGRALPGNQRRHEAIFGGKTERAISFSIVGICLYFQPNWIIYINPTFELLSILVFLTAALRIYKIKKQTANKPYQSKPNYGE